MKLSLLQITLCAAILNFFCALNAQNPLSETIPLDTSVLKKTLPNGITYYIRENAMPKNRVEMRLVVNAGSMQESDAQQGLAHFAEHMCFNGTKHFEKSALVDFLENTGVRFGADLNAYTSFDETVYFFKIPTERSSLIDTAFMVLEDWAHLVSFENEEIDKERGVVIEEWRLHLGAQERMRQKYFPVALKGSRYAERLPIGKVYILETFEYDTIKQFYKDWYRPDLMSVIVVGDIDKGFIESKIIEHFSKLKNPSNAKPRLEYDIPNNVEPLISVVTDPETPYSVIEMFYKHDRKPEGKVGDYRRALTYMLYNGMLGARLNERLQEPNVPFVFAKSKYGGFLGRSKDAYSVTAVAKDNMILESLNEILVENQRVLQYGFTEGELERQKKNILTGYQRSVKELGKTNSNNYANEYTRNFLNNEPIPGIVRELEYAETFLPHIGLEEINNLAKAWITDENQVIIVTMPEKDELKVPTNEELLNVIKLSNSQKVDAYEDGENDTELLPIISSAGSIEKEVYNEAFDFHHWTLSNGGEVIVKSTNFKNDQVLFLASSDGGESLYEDHQFLNARFSATVSELSGVGSFNRIELAKKLAGNTAGVSYQVGPYSEQVNGNASPDDLETLLGLNYLYFTESRLDTSAFSAFKSRALNQIKYLKDDPKKVYSDTTNKVISGMNKRNIVIYDKSHVDQIDPDLAIQYFKERFRNANDFRFVIVGNINIDSIKPLVTKYIGGLPGTKYSEKWINREEAFPEGLTNIVVHKGQEPQSAVTLAFEGKTGWSSKRKLAYTQMAKILNIKLRENLREDQGGVYGVRVSTNAQTVPSKKYHTRISFGCAPENVDTLILAVFDEIKTLQTSGATKEDLNKVTETLIRAIELNLEKNNYWLNVLNKPKNKLRKMRTKEEMEAEIKKIQSKHIKKAAKKFFKLNRYVQSILMPEKE